MGAVYYRRTNWRDGCASSYGSCMAVGSCPTDQAQRLNCGGLRLFVVSLMRSSWPRSRLGNSRRRQRQASTPRKRLCSIHRPFVTDCLQLTRWDQQQRRHRASVSTHAMLDIHRLQRFSDRSRAIAAPVEQPALAAAATTYGTKFSPMAKADPPATQHTVACRRSAAHNQGGGVGKRSKFTPASLMSPEELVVKHAETTRKLHLAQTRERAKETLLETQARLAMEQQRRVVAEAELAEKTLPDRAHGGPGRVVRWSAPRQLLAAGGGSNGGAGGGVAERGDDAHLGGACMQDGNRVYPRVQ